MSSIKFKEGDLVDLTIEGLARFGHYFEDNIYTGLKVAVVTDSGSYRVHQSDNRNTWWISDLCIAHIHKPTNDPSTWKCNTPIVVTYIKRGIPKHRHFSHCVGHRIHYYYDGKTSFSSRDGKTMSRDMKYVRKATKEELQ